MEKWKFGFPIGEPGIPESFKVMVKEFQSLGLDIRILTEENKEVSINELSNDDLEPAPFITKSKEPTQDIELNLDDEVTTSDIVSEEDAASAQQQNDDMFEDFDEDSLFDDLE